MEGSLVCESCGHDFEIRGGVPRLLPSVESKDIDQGRTVDRFAFEWTRFSTFDAEEERVSMETWLSPQSLDDLTGLTVLDAGCGMGRHAVVASQSGVQRLVGIDLGEAVEAAFSNTRHLPEVCIVQGDLRDLPLADDSFDAAYSIGVLHHLADPRIGFNNIARKIRPGGWAHLWLYGREGNSWIRVANRVRTISSRLPLRLLNFLCGLASIPLTIATKTVYRLPKLRRILPYHRYMSWLAQFSWRKIHAIVFDHALAPVSHYLSRNEALALVDRPDYEVIGLEHSRGMSWGVTVRRKIIPPIGARSVLGGPARSSSQPRNRSCQDG
jgi:SAM-dependent methyltransferase